MSQSNEIYGFHAGICADPSILLAFPFHTLDKAISHEKSISICAIDRTVSCKDLGFNP